MSTKALFGGLVEMLQGQNWSPEQRRLVDTICAFASSEAPIQLTDGPLVFENHTPQAAIQITGNADSRALEITTAGGQKASMGVGLGNTGLVANEFIPLAEFMLAAEVVQQFLSVMANKGGGVTQTPGEPPETTTPYTLQPASAPGNLPSNTPADVGSVAGQTFCGPGRPTGYPSPVQPAPVIEQETASGGGPGSGGGAPSGFPVLKRAGQMPILKGRATGTGKPGVAHDMQVLTPWAEVLGYGRHSDRGMEFCLGNRRYYWPLASTTGASASKTVVTAVSCTAGTLSVTTETWTFVDGLFTGAS